VVLVNKTEAGLVANDARIAKQLSWAGLAEAIDAPLMWTISAVLGQHPIPSAQARTLADLLGLDDEATEQLTRQPSRGSGVPSLPTDPTLYRFYEALMVYGPAIKEFIHEEFGDGIMSAINFRLDAERVEDDGGDRVVLTFNGKFLPYQWG
jgi:cyanate lyase